MLIASLYELAQRKQLISDPDIDWHRIDIVIRLDSEGGVVGVDHVSKDGKPRMSLAPRVPVGRSGATSNPALLFDNASYVLGVGPVAERRYDDFWRLVSRVAHESAFDAGLWAMISYFRSENRSKVIAALPEWPAGAWIAFQLDGEEGLIHERPAVLAWHRNERAKAASGTTTCMITGTHGAAARLHPFVRMPGTKGAALVSFNLPCFERQGAEQGDNAPMGREVAEGYVTALNWLLAKTETRRHRGATGFGQEVLVAWDTMGTDSGHPSPAQELLDLLEGTLTLQDTMTGDARPLMAVLLGSNRSRVVVRHVIDAPSLDVFSALELFAVHIGWGTDESLPSLAWMGEALGFDPVTPSFATAMLRSMLDAAPLPRAIAPRAVLRLRRADLGDKTRRLLLGLLAGSLTRGEERPPMALDETSTQVPYVLGRLFAITESLQYRAHGVRVGATIRDRFFSPAMQRPASTFPRLMVLSRAHGKKAYHRVGSSWYEAQKDQILSLLGTSSLPPVLSLSEQGLFILGYHQQRGAIFAYAASVQPKTTDQ